MEITTAPRRPAPTPWGRLLLFVVAPRAGHAPGAAADRARPRALRHDRRLDGAARHRPRARSLFERVVPVSDLRVGDVITYRAARRRRRSTAMVTHRIVADPTRTGIVHPGRRRAGSATRGCCARRRRPCRGSTSRVPWVGWAYLLARPTRGAGCSSIASAAALVVLTRRRGDRSSRRPASRTSAPPGRRPEAVRPGEATSSEVNREQCRRLRPPWALCSLPWRNGFWWSRTRRTSRSPSSARWSARATTSPGSTAARRLSTPCRPRPTLVILDLGLPDIDGLEVCRRAREAGFEGAIMIVTARAGELDRVVGLDYGADDYLAKPFGLAELQARVRALLRRTSSRRRRAARTAAPTGCASTSTPAGSTPATEEVPLTGKEFEVLEHPGRQPGQGRLPRSADGRRVGRELVRLDQDARRHHRSAAPEAGERGRDRSRGGRSRRGIPPRRRRPPMRERLTAAFVVLSDRAAPGGRHRCGPTCCGT